MATPVFFGAEGQWNCGCGYVNHELRRRCRNCRTQRGETPPADVHRGPPDDYVIETYSSSGG